MFGAAAYIALPGCEAWILQVPAAATLIVAPETVHTGVVSDVNETGRPDEAVALIVNGATPYVFPVIAGKVMVWDSNANAGAGKATAAASKIRRAQRAATLEGRGWASDRLQSARVSSVHLSTAARRARVPARRACGRTCSSGDAATLSPQRVVQPAAGRHRTRTAPRDNIHGYRGSKHLQK
jgi:hypothetical protein